MDDPNVHKPHKLALDPSLYRPDPGQVAFLKQTTGIHDDELLKEHVLQLQKEAFAIHGYPCICRFAFIDFKMAKLPAYPDALKLKDGDPDAILLDCGCFFGTDVRKAVIDGWPADKVIGTDLRQDYIDMGKKLFQAASEPGKSPHFVAGDLFSDEFLDPKAPQADSLPPLLELKTLTTLIGRVRVLGASSLFHLFSEDHQRALAMRLFPLMVQSKPGSILLGSHVALPEKGFRGSRPGTDWRMFCHSPESWRQLWEEVADHYGKKVEVQGQLLDLAKIWERRHLNLRDPSHEETPMFEHLLWWSVRLL